MVISNIAQVVLTRVHIHTRQSFVRVLGTGAVIYDAYELHIYHVVRAFPPWWAYLWSIRSYARAFAPRREITRSIFDSFQNIYVYTVFIYI